MKYRGVDIGSDPGDDVVEIPQARDGDHA